MQPKPSQRIEFPFPIVFSIDSHVLQVSETPPPKRKFAAPKTRNQNASLLRQNHDAVT